MAEELAEEQSGNTTSSGSIALAMMQQELPQYIQNMFKAAGYETLQTIAEMDVRLNSESNDIDRMLEYIKHNFPKDTRLVLIYRYVN